MFLTQVANNVRIRLATKIKLSLNIEMCLLKFIWGHKLEVPFAVGAFVAQHLGENRFGLWNDFGGNQG